MTLNRETVHYRADGIDMIGTLYIDGYGAGCRPGILVFPEALGAGPNVHARAARLAELGYAAFACDLHGGGQLLVSLADALPLLDAIRSDPGRMRARGRGALDVMRAHPRIDRRRIAAIGFCFGGTVALELGRGGAQLAAIAGFHCGLSTADPRDARFIAGRVLVCIGADDPAIPPEQRATFETEMREGGVDWSMQVYGGVVHAFTDKAAERFNRPEFARYDLEADRQSWTAMTQLLAVAFR